MTIRDLNKYWLWMRRLWPFGLLTAALLFIVIVYSISYTTGVHQTNSHPLQTLPDSKRWNRFIRFNLSSVISSQASRRLPPSGSLFCYVLTTPKYHASRVLAVNRTWLSDCDHGEFFSTFPQLAADDDKFAVRSSVPFSFVFEKIPDDYAFLFHKSIASLRFLYQRYPNFDWYYKADDDTFVIVENLRLFLAKHDAEEPLYMGFRMKPYLKHGYNSGGAGYVLSRAALHLFNQRLLSADNRTEECQFNIVEDVGIAKCLESIGIVPMDTRNERLQQRFNAYNAEDVYEKRIGDEWIFDPQLKGESAMAADLVSLHHVSPKDMRTYHQLVHKVGRELERNSRKRGSLPTQAIRTESLS